MIGVKRFLWTLLDDQISNLSCTFCNRNFGYLSHCTLFLKKKLFNFFLIILIIGPFQSTLIAVVISNYHVIITRLEFNSGQGHMPGL